MFSFPQQLSYTHLHLAMHAGLPQLVLYYGFHPDKKCWLHSEALLLFASGFYLTSAVNISSVSHSGKYHIPNIAPQNSDVEEIIHIRRHSHKLFPPST